MTVKLRIAPRMYGIHATEDWPNIMTEPKRKSIGMRRLKKRKARLRIASRMRDMVRTQMLCTLSSYLSSVCRLRRSLLAQAAAGELDEDVFERRRKHFEALEFAAF